MWLVLIDKKGWMVHSFHFSEPVARSWAECKSHDGEEVTVAFVPSETLKDLVAEATKKGM